MGTPSTFLPFGKGCAQEVVTANAPSRLGLPDASVRLPTSYGGCLGQRLVLETVVQPHAIGARHGVPDTFERADPRLRLDERAPARQRCKGA